MGSCKDQVTFVVPSRRMDDLLFHCVTKTEEVLPGVAFIAVIDENEISSVGSFSLPDNVTVLHSAKTTISAKRNIGSEYAKTKYVAFIDSDAYPNEGWLENGIEFLETHPEYGLATGIQKNFPTDSPISCAIRRLRLSPLFTSSELLCFYDDRRQETRDKRQETRDKRQETRDKRQETRDWNTGLSRRYFRRFIG